MSGTVLIMHVWATGVVVGLGLPLYIWQTTTSLKKKNDLSALNGIASLFELYRPQVPHFEAFVLLRKSFLMLVTIHVIASSSILQASLSLVVNLLYLALFIFVSPMVYHPSTLLNNVNLFSLTEISAGVTTIFGNIVAILISWKSGSDEADSSDRSYDCSDDAVAPIVVGLGILFAVLNIVLVVAILYFWDRDKKARIDGGGSILRTVTGAARIYPTVQTTENDDDDDGCSKSGATPIDTGSVVSDTDKEMIDIEADWQNLLKTIRGLDSHSKKQESVKDELPYVHSKVVSFVRRFLSDASPTVSVIDRYDDILRRVDKDIAEMGRVPVTSAKCDSCLEVALKGGLWRVALMLLEEGGRNLSFPQLDSMGERTAHFFECYVNIHYAFDLLVGSRVEELFAYGGREQLREDEVDDFVLILLCGVEEGFRKGTPWLLDGTSASDMKMWRGITVDDADGRVTAIDWSHEYLRGVIHPAIGFLTMLKSLTLTMNSIEGGLPLEMGRCESLEYVDVSYNKITGSVPLQLVKCSQLVYFGKCRGGG